jgi:hypothetical protein
MRKYLYFFAVGWAIILFGACQSDSINPASTVVPSNNSIEDLMSQPFTLDMYVYGPAAYVDPLAEVKSDRRGNTELPSVGSVDVFAQGESDRISIFEVRGNFRFDPMTCASDGFLKAEFENGFVYAFEINGVSHLDATLFTSDGITFPVKLVYSTEPGVTEFEAYFYMENPDCLAAGQDGVVRRRAYFTKYAPLDRPESPNVPEGA